MILLVIVLGIILFVLLATIGWVIGSYNTFVHAFQDVMNQWSNIKTEYQRRADLFLNLVESTKSYKKFEKETMTAITQARGGNFGKTQAMQAKKLNALDGIFQKLMLVVEAYPNLKANEQHNTLMNEIRLTEDRINVARTDYNELVNDYNTLVLEFPKNILAHVFGFRAEAYFENEEEATKAPRIKLD